MHVIQTSKTLAVVSMLGLAACSTSSTFPMFDQTPIELSNAVSGYLVEDEGCVKLKHGDRTSALVWMKGTKFLHVEKKLKITDYTGRSKYEGEYVTIIGGDADRSSLKFVNRLEGYLTGCGENVLTAYRFSEK